MRAISANEPRFDTVAMNMVTLVGALVDMPAPTCERHGAELEGDRRHHDAMPDDDALHPVPCARSCSGYRIERAGEPYSIDMPYNNPGGNRTSTKY